MVKATRVYLIEERKRRRWSQQELADHLGTTRNNVGRWELGLTTPGPYFRTKLCELFGKSAQELALFPEQAYGKCQLNTQAMIDSSDAPVISIDQKSLLWYVPYPRNSFFTGRDRLLHSLDRILRRKEGTAVHTQSYILYGLGGIGKTQIALEYTHRYASAYTAILWIRAETHDTLRSSFALLAEVLNLPEQHEQDQHKVQRAIIRWLGEQRGWLLILDNIEDLALIQPFLLASRQGAILITTRLQAVGPLAQQIMVDAMDAEEGLAFLLRRAKLLSPGQLLSCLSVADIRAAQAIVEAMDCLPLALDQAGAYIEETKCCLEDYLRWYHQRRLQLLKRRGSSSQDHPASVQTTLALSFQQAEQQNPVAGDVLRLCAFLASDAIPEEIFIKGCASGSEHLQTLTREPWSLDEAIAVLGMYSLVDRNAQTKTLSLHRLVQAVLQESLSEQKLKEWIGRVITAINLSFPEVEPETWNQCERLVPHVLQCVKHATLSKLVSGELATLLLKTGQYLTERAQYQDAESLLKRALQIREQLLGIEHLDVAAALHALANLSLLQGKYPEAEVFYGRALGIREQGLGAEHLLVSHLLNPLGLLYSEQGRYAEAEALLTRALAIRERILGAEHPKVADTLNNLGLLANKQGRYAEAEPLLARALAIRERTLGIEHPQMANPLINLGILCYEQGKYAEADSLFTRALQNLEQALGAEHPQVTYPLIDLGMSYRKQQRYAEAEAVLTRALQVSEQELGPEHPQVAYSLDSLGILACEQGRYAEAEVLLKRAFHLREQTRGINHPETAESWFGLACLYLNQCFSARAQQCYQQALAIWGKTLGLDHSHVSRSIEQYAQLESQQSRPEPEKV